MPARRERAPRPRSRGYFLLSVALTAALLVCASCRSAPAPQPGAGAARALPRSLTIVGINDTHGALLSAPAPKPFEKGLQIGGAEWFAGYLRAVRADAAARGSPVVVLDGGDEFQGTLVSNQFGGKSVVEVYDALGVSASAIGNHEFDFGLDVLQARIAQAHYPVLAANIFLRGTQTRPAWLKPWAWIEAGGLKVAVIGLATKETPLVTNTANIKDFEFVPGGPVAARLADELRAQGAQIVLIAAHAGPALPEGEIQAVAEACRGKVDAIVSGHNHKSLTEPLEAAGIPIVQSGAKLVAFSVIELQLDAQGHRIGFTTNAGTTPKAGGPQALLHGRGSDGLEVARFRGRPVEPDAKIAALVQGYDAQVQKLRELPIGASEVTLRKDGDNLLGALASEGLRAGEAGGERADVAVQNYGGLRVPEIAAGPVSFGQVFDLYPFDNQVVYVELSTTELRDALESVLRAGKGPLIPAGVRYVVDWERVRSGDALRTLPPGAAITQMTDARTGKILCESRACDGQRCTPGCVEGRWTLALTDFLANGGDGVKLPRTAPRHLGPVLARDLIVGYVKKHQPLTAKLLSAPSAGAPPRITQRGHPPGERD